jgi:hypothetical protein
MSGFLEGLQKLGWRDDENMRGGYRHALDKLAAELAAAPFGIELIPIDLRQADEIERASQ